MDKDTELKTRVQDAVRDLVGVQQNEMAAYRSNNIGEMLAAWGLHFERRALFILHYPVFLEYLVNDDRLDLADLRGVIEPDAVRMATSVYRDDSDDLGRFLRQCCILGEDLPNRPFRIAKVDLYPIYEAWAKQSGGYAYESRAFTKAMVAKGFVSKSSNGDKWLGIIAGVSAVELNSGNWTALDEKEGENRGGNRDFGTAENDSDLDGYDWS